MDLRIKIGKIVFENPLWVASGTFGSGEDFEDLVDLNKIGAIVAKTITFRPRKGNPTPRIAETPSGLLNSIGLENKGIKAFKEIDIPFLKKFKTRSVVSIAGENEDDFIKCARELTGKYEPDAIEVNLSCPNISHKGAKYKMFAQDEKATTKIIKLVKKETRCAVIAKLTPNVTDIGAIARASEKGGADAVSLVNTYPGMAVNAETMKPLLGRVTGGLSGPAIKPMALKAVWDVYNSVKIPVVGIGGIMNGIDAAEFMICGAAAVQLGTVNFVEPDAYNRVLKEFTDYLKRKGIKKVTDLVGKLTVIARSE